MMGFALGFALKHPVAAQVIANIWGVVKRYWKVALALFVFVGAWIWFNSWKNDLIETADAAGFARAEAQYVEAVERANERERKTQATLDKLAAAFGPLAQMREQRVTLTVQPMIERIKNEVANDPRYRECAVSDGVLFDINAGRAAADASISASAPSSPRQGS